VRILSEYTGRGPDRARTHINEEIITVEQRSGRVVSAFLSANHLEPDVCIESFVLEPDGSSKSTAPPETEWP